MIRPHVLSYHPNRKEEEARRHNRPAPRPPHLTLNPIKCDLGTFSSFRPMTQLCCLSPSKKLLEILFTASRND